MIYREYIERKLKDGNKLSVSNANADICVAYKKGFFLKKENWAYNRKKEKIKGIAGSRES